MLSVRPISKEHGTWGAFRETGEQVLWIETRPCEAWVRIYDGSRSGNRGPLLVTFVGRECLALACTWAKRFSRGPSRKASVRSKGKKFRQGKNCLTVS